MCIQRVICLCNMTAAQEWAVWHGFWSPGSWTLDLDCLDLHSWSAFTSSVVFASHLLVARQLWVVARQHWVVAQQFGVVARQQWVVAWIKQVNLFQALRAVLCQHLPLPHSVMLPLQMTWYCLFTLFWQNISNGRVWQTKCEIKFCFFFFEAVCVWWGWGWWGPYHI